MSLATMQTLPAAQCRCLDSGCHEGTVLTAVLVLGAHWELKAALVAPFGAVRGDSVIPIPVPTNGGWLSSHLS